MASASPQRHWHNLLSVTPPPLQRRSFLANLSRPPAAYGNRPSVNLSPQDWMWGDGGLGGFVRGAVGGKVLCSLPRPALPIISLNSPVSGINYLCCLFYFIFLIICLFVCLFVFCLNVFFFHALWTRSLWWWLWLWILILREPLFGWRREVTVGSLLTCPIVRSALRTVFSFGCRLRRVRVPASLQSHDSLSFLTLSREKKEK